MLKNRRHPDGYMGVEGVNLLQVFDDDGNMVGSNLSRVWWIGKGSPYPTPPGGPWRTTYIDKHHKFGKCWIIHTDMERDVMLHHANEQSMGCVIVNNDVDDNKFYSMLLDHRHDLAVLVCPPVDSRSDADKDANPIDYDKIGRIG